MILFPGEDVNDVYDAAVRTLMDEGETVGIDRPEAVDNVTLELNPAAFVIANPRRRLVTAYGRPINVAFALAEVLWIFAGRRDVEMLEFYNSTIGQFSDDGEVFNAAYGHRLRHSYGFDQIEDVVRTLAADHTSRQGTLVITNPVDDKGWNRMGDHANPAELVYRKKITKDRACNLISRAMIRSGRLNWLQVLRSNDIVWGTPYNWMQFMHLQEYMAVRLGVEIGKFTMVCDSLHMYRHHFDDGEKIRSFDLYQTYNWDHHRMYADNTALQAVAKAEEIIRQGDERPNLEEATLSDKAGLYWMAALRVLNAHWLYKQHKDPHAFLALLECGDPVLGVAQIRFYYSTRWHKDEKMREMCEAHLPPIVCDWIFNEEE